MCLAGTNTRGSRFEPFYCIDKYFYRPQGKVMFSQVSVYPQLASRLQVHCSAFLRRGRYGSYWNAFLLSLISMNSVKTFREKSTDLQWLTCDDGFESLSLRVVMKN